MKLQKIMIDAGFTCPNRDGKVGTGGCSYCRTDSFSPAYCHGDIARQLSEGKRFFSGKYPEMKYLAYFQAYSNTYAPLDVLRQRYEEALTVPEVVGLVIGTRPDCLSDEVLAYLSSLNITRTHVVLEIGVESFYDATLRRINRGHTAQDSLLAIRRSATAGLPVTIHLIIGLPGETRQMILDETEQINALPITAVKLHQLQILRGTRMLDDWQQHPSDFLSPTLEEYVSLLREFKHRLRPDITIERYASSAPSHLLVAPRWGLKPSQIEAMVK